MEIEHEKQYNPKELSAKISCRNMSILSHSDIQKQNELFNSQINYDECVMNSHFLPNIKCIKNAEDDLLRGVSINKKSCIYKRPEYSEGKWKNQFSHHIYDNDNLFEYQTKAKANDFTTEIICDYKNMQIPNSFYDRIDCDNGKYFVYTKTFANDYYSCLI